MLFPDSSCTVCRVSVREVAEGVETVGSVDCRNGFHCNTSLFHLFQIGTIFDLVDLWRAATNNDFLLLMNLANRFIYKNVRKYHFLV